MMIDSWGQLGSITHAYLVDCCLIQSTELENASDKEPRIWPQWMAVHVRSEND